jgi:hypothetical protein
MTFWQTGFGQMAFGRQIFWSKGVRSMFKVKWFTGKITFRLKNMFYQINPSVNFTVKSAGQTSIAQNILNRRAF